MPIWSSLIQDIKTHFLSTIHLSSSSRQHCFILSRHSLHSCRSFTKMPSLVSSLSALAIVSLAAASPIRRAKQAFTVHQDVAKPFTPGPVQMWKTYQKYGVAPPPDVLAAATDGTVTATPEQYDAEYLCPVTIGGQTLNLDFDTGSADL
jgi:aspergillopepsin I